MASQSFLRQYYPPKPLIFVLFAPKKTVQSYQNSHYITLNKHCLGIFQLILQKFQPLLFQMKDHKKKLREEWP